MKRRFSQVSEAIDLTQDDCTTQSVHTKDEDTKTHKLWPIRSGLDRPADRALAPMNDMNGMNALPNPSSDLVTLSSNAIPQLPAISLSSSQSSSSSKTHNKAARIGSPIASGNPSSQASHSNTLTSSSKPPHVYPLSQRFLQGHAKHIISHKTSDQKGQSHTMPFCRYLTAEELHLVRSKPPAYLEQRAKAILKHHIGAASPWRDGSQTPYHSQKTPIYCAQHCTRTCCRSCIRAFHHIPKGRALRDDELDRLCHVVCQWLAYHASTSCSGSS